MATNEDNRPATFGDLKLLKSEVLEAMRDMQTEILRGMEVFVKGGDVRFRKIEADVSNINAASSARLSIVEARLLEIEKRLGLDGPPRQP